MEESHVKTAEKYRNHQWKLYNFPICIAIAEKYDGVQARCEFKSSGWWITVSGAKLKSSGPVGSRLSRFLTDWSNGDEWDTQGKFDGPWTFAFSKDGKTKTCDPWGVRTLCTVDEQDREASLNQTFASIQPVPPQALLQGLSKEHSQKFLDVIESISKDRVLTSTHVHSVKVAQLAADGEMERILSLILESLKAMGSVKIAISQVDYYWKAVGNYHWIATSRNVDADWPEKKYQVIANEYSVDGGKNWETCGTESVAFSACELEIIKALKYD